MRARQAIALVARREVTERVRERSFLISTGLSAFIVVLVVVLAALLGSSSGWDVGVTDAHSRAVARAAAAAARGSDQPIHVREVPAGEADEGLDDGGVDVVIAGDTLRAKDRPDDQLVALLQGAQRAVAARETLRRAGVDRETAQRALDPPPLRVSTLEPVDPEEDALAGVAFVTVILLYGQLLTYGYWVAAGVVEEKASRVVEVMLATLRPRHLLAGKVTGLGALALGHLLAIAVIGVIAATATGAVTMSASTIGAIALAVAWFVAGYAFYACAFACAGALVPRQEELQSVTTPLTMTILVGFFCSLAVNEDPDGVLAHVTAFIPMTAPLTMPGRIITGDVAALEVAGALAVTLGAAAAIIPLAARIYEGGILRTGSAIKLRDAWRAARA